MPLERFEGEEEVLRAPVGPSELRLVLHDLSHDEAEEMRAERVLPDDHVTAQAIAETLDIPIEKVYEAIARVRRNDVREHVSKVLSELEEPTHRVERPGPTTKDPLLTNYGFRREQIFDSVLDKLPRPGKTEPKQEKAKPSEPTAVEKAISYVVMVAIAGGICYYAVVGLVQLLSK
jgi:hypothetical protein